ncbi:MAG: hypothetical protein GXN91_05890, partial [Epsilonproteobacteria bacterium]|nr:hypothetical protein [Campylobacterota bacterium]
MGKLSKKIGLEAEKKAVLFLEQNGFFIVERNFYAKKYGEIDIVAKKGDVL